MLELARSMREHARTSFFSFAERGLCGPFLLEARKNGFEAIALKHDTPRLAAALRELAGQLQTARADVLCCHGYKGNLLGLLAARWLRIPVISVSRGWTAETRRVRMYESLDRRLLQWMDRVVCVSEGQAEKVRAAGVPHDRIAVIHNAIRLERFDGPHKGVGGPIRGLFSKPPTLLIGSAGRLSPEKGFQVLVEAAAKVVQELPGAGFVHFGDGALRTAIEKRIRELGIQEQFRLAGFREDLDAMLPHLDLFVLPSFTEGLPNVVLEAFAASVPVVATRVGGTPEVVDHGASGLLVPPNDPAALARSLCELLSDPARRRAMGRAGHRRVARDFSFAAQARAYRRLLDELTARPMETARTVHLEPRRG